MELLSTVGIAIINNAPILVGFILPPIVEVINRDVKTSRERFVVTILVCLFSAILLHWKEIEYGTPEQVALFAGILFAESKLLYKFYFAKSDLRGGIQRRVGTTWMEKPVVDTPIE